MAGYSTSLNAIFAANDKRRRGEPSKLTREAAEARVKGEGWGQAIGTGLGAAALLNPATAPFAGLLMGAGKTAGGYVGRVATGGSAVPTATDAMGAASSLGALPTDQKDFDKLKGLIKAWQYPSKEK